MRTSRPPAEPRAAGATLPGAARHGGKTPSRASGRSARRRPGTPARGCLAAGTNRNVVCPPEKGRFAIVDHRHGDAVGELLTGRENAQQFVGRSVQADADLLQHVDRGSGLAAGDGAEISGAEVAEFGGGFIGKLLAVADAQDEIGKFFGEHVEPSPSVRNITVSVEATYFALKERSCLDFSAFPLLRLRAKRGTPAEKTKKIPTRGLESPSFFLGKWPSDYTEGRAQRLCARQGDGARIRGARPANSVKSPGSSTTSPASVTRHSARGAISTVTARDSPGASSTRSNAQRRSGGRAWRPPRRARRTPRALRRGCRSRS